MPTTPNELMQQAVQKFLKDNADVLSLLKGLTIAELRKKLAAVMEINPDFSAEILMHADPAYLNQFGHAGRVARESFSNACLVGICKSFEKLQRNCQLIFNVRWADFPEAHAQLEEIQRIAEGREPLPPAPPPKSAEEILDEEIRHDWLRLGVDKIRRKCNSSPAYKRRFDELIATDALKSGCTSLVDGSQGF